MTQIYETDNTNTYRYALGEIAGDKTLLCVALNPSVADTEKGDRTYTFCRNEAKLSGYSSFIMMNLYPLRSTDRNLLPEECDATHMDKNLQVFQQMLRVYPNADIWAAWGNSIGCRTYFTGSLKQMYAASKEQNWMYYGELTKCGNPHYPSRMEHHLEFHAFSISEYMKRYL